MGLFLLRKPESPCFYGLFRIADVSKWWQMKHPYIAASFQFLLLVCIIFVCRSYSTAGADQGPVTIQHSFEDPTAARRDQGRQATSEGDEEGKRIPCNL